MQFTRLVLASLLVVASLLAPLAAQDQELRTPPQHPGEPHLAIDVSFLLNDVMRILDDEQAIEADVFYRLEWTDDRLAEPGAETRWLPLDGIWSPTFEAASPRSLREVLPRLAVVDAEGRVRVTQRVLGRFGASTYLADYPFDSHEIEFPFYFATGGARVDLEIRPGPILGRSEAFSIPNWTLGEPRMSTEPIRIAPIIPPVPAATLTIRAERNSRPHVLGILVPLVVIVMMSWTVFWTPPSQISVQFGFAATSILTVIAYRFALTNETPPVPYMTRMDVFLNGSFALTFLALVEVVVTSRLIHSDRTAAAERVDHVCRFAFPVALAALAAVAFA